MKRPVLVALADACGVSIEWLATGRGLMLSEAYRSLLATGLFGETFAPTHMVHTPEYRRLMALPGEPPGSTPSLAAPEDHSHSPAQSAAREHQESVAPPPLVDPVRLQQAVSIIRALNGDVIFHADDIGERLANTYNILSGVKL